MGSVNTKSVREEAERIKSEFDLITANKKLDPQVSILIQSMFMLINLLISIFLEKTTKKTNKNSSKPSSQTKKMNHQPQTQEQRVKENRNQMLLQAIQEP